MDTSKIEYVTKDEEADEYGRIYLRVPFLVNAKYTDVSGKEFLYNDDIFFFPCEVVTESIGN